jgi:hypothetical protein
MRKVILGALLAITPPAAALANGTVSGTVRVEHAPAKPPAVKIGKDATVCGREAASEALLIGAEGALANAVVWLADVKGAGPPGPTPNAAIDQVGCRYTPHVQAVTVGTALNLLNNDAVLHNVRGTIGAGGGSPMTVFNVAMPFKGQRLPTVLKKPGVMKLRCDAGHTWMGAYVHVFEHPWFAVTDAKGAFTIKDVPPGSYRLQVWHEPLDDKAPPAAKAVPVEVSDGAPAKVTLVLPL